MASMLPEANSGVMGRGRRETSRGEMRPRRSVPADGSQPCLASHGIITMFRRSVSTRIGHGGNKHCRSPGYIESLWPLFASQGTRRVPVVPTRADKRNLIALAWLNVVVHGIALVLAVVSLRPGSPLVPLSVRLHYLANHSFIWSVGWGAWMLCALALIAFFAAVAHQVSGQQATLHMAMLLAAAGGAIDLFCDVLYITVLPMLAARTPPSTIPDKRDRSTRG